ncbi:hypothetical protein Vadar_029363 [Vaccinium darrowii]|uniref:Uncharacterized protein n=1 Tax=Vaccinium darrowii TaxID=229202 RepID=A0ACB7YSM9_9ERIC|nr:hypothetical protein Vadar_029363 [Vaccinium darrowii]
MSGYPHNQPGYGYNPPPPGPPQPHSTAPYASAPPQPGHQPYAPVSTPYGAPSAPYASPVDKPSKDKPYGGAGYPPQVAQPYGSPFTSLVPSVFPPGTDPSVSFGLRTVHLLMYLFTNTNTRKIGPKEFTAVFYSLQSWRAIFEKFDRDRSGRIDSGELREALLSLGFAVSPAVLELLVSKFDKTGGKNRAIEYDNFIECCLTVKGLTEKFKEKDTMYSGSATFAYESFMLTVLPFLIA